MTKKLGVLLCAVTLSLISVSSAHAATLTGWAWSDTFGWISFNSTDAGAGGGPYSVSVNSSGAWSGYAWSPNAGWVSFNSSDVSACGSAGQLNTSTGAVTGWGRALAYGGTDGCIELSGTNHVSPSSGGSGGITYDSSSGVFKGYAWDNADSTSKIGTGWIQFNPPGISNPVSCLAADCGYSANITGNCSATTPYQNISPNTSVTFQANPTSGTSPYTYAWNPPPSTYSAPNQYTATYATSAVGPTVVMKDSNGLVTTTVSCPAVTVLNPLSSSNIQIGRTVSTANSNSLTIKQTNAFAVTWNFTLSSGYSCSPTLTSGGSSTNGGYSGWDTYWRSTVLASTSNGDGTKTWNNNTGTNLKAGTVATPVTPGVYLFGISCTSSSGPTQSINATLKVDSSSQKEI